MIVEYNISILSYAQQEQDKMNDELHKEEKKWKEKFKQHEVCVVFKQRNNHSPFEVNYYAWNGHFKIILPSWYRI